MARQREQTPLGYASSSSGAFVACKAPFGVPLEEPAAAGLVYDEIPLV